MKKMHKVLSAILSMFLLCSTAVPVFALDAETSSGTATVSYSESATFSAEIPAFVEPAEPGEQDVGAYTVTAEDVVIPDNSVLTAIVEYSGVVRDKNGVEIPYTLYTADGAISSGDTVLKKNAGEPSTTATVSFGVSVDEEPRYAGVYTDTAKFTFSVKEKVYTTEEIEADEHLYAIGETKPEYVVAKFNDDYSEVTIFANGEDSDGLMADFSASITSTISPMQTYKSSLISATIQDGVKSIGAYAFYHCSALERASLTDDISKAGNSSFAGCASLQTVNLPANLSTIPQYMFSGCSSLKSIDFPQKVTSIGMRAFQGCGFETLVIPTTVNTVNNGGAFANCTDLQTVIAGNQSFGFSFDGTNRSGAFAGCTALESIDLSEYNDTKIPPNLLNGCTALTSVELGENITQIYVGAFVGCTSLKNLTLPASVVSIGTGATSGSSPQVFDGALESLTCLGAKFNGITNQSMGIEDSDDQVIFYVYEDNASTWIAAWGTPEETANTWFPIVII